MDEFTIGAIAGFMMAFVVASIVFLVQRWRDGDSRDTLPNGVESSSEPDLTTALIEHALEETAARVAFHGLPLAELASHFDAESKWVMTNGRRGASIALPADLFLDIERLSIAVRAQRGDKLSELETAVLHGVLKPMRFQPDAMPTLMLDDAT